MSRNNLKKTLGIIEQEDEKEQSPYQSILNLLSPNPGGKENGQRNILQELEGFHRYYNQRHEEFKSDYERIKQQNWQYATRIMKYEQALENCQAITQQDKQHTAFLEDKIHELTQLVQAKEKEIVQLKGELIRLGAKHEVPKKRVVKLKERSIRVEQEETINLESARSHRQMNSLKNEIQQYAVEAEQLGRENEQLKKKVRHLEADRKYEDERLRNATLALQLDLKIKNEQIERLNHQVEVYEKKFQQLIQTFRVNSLHNCDKETVHIADFEKDPARDFRFEDHWRNLEMPEKTLGEDEADRTHRKLDLDRTIGQRSRDKTHKRHGSSNLEENRKENKKEELSLKIKVFRYNSRKLI